MASISVGASSPSYYPEIPLQSDSSQVNQQKHDIKDSPAILAAFTKKSGEVSVSVESTKIAPIDSTPSDHIENRPLTTQISPDTMNKLGGLTRFFKNKI